MASVAAPVGKVVFVGACMALVSVPTAVVTWLGLTKLSLSHDPSTGMPVESVWAFPVGTLGAPIAVTLVGAYLVSATRSWMNWKAGACAGAVHGALLGIGALIAQSNLTPLSMSTFVVLPVAIACGAAAAAAGARLGTS